MLLRVNGPTFLFATKNGQARWSKMAASRGDPRMWSHHEPMSAPSRNGKLAQMFSSKLEGKGPACGNQPTQVGDSAIPPRQPAPHATWSRKAFPGQLMERTAPRPWFWGPGWRDFSGRISLTGFLEGPRLREGYCYCWSEWTGSRANLLNPVWVLHLGGSHSKLNSVCTCIIDRSFLCSLFLARPFAVQTHFFNSRPPFYYFKLPRLSCFLRATADLFQGGHPPHLRLLPSLFYNSRHSRVHRLRSRDTTSQPTSKSQTTAVMDHSSHGSAGAEECKVEVRRPCLNCLLKYCHPLRTIRNRGKE